MVFLGIDTSCYTTSFAAVNEEGALIADNRRLLVVPQKARGLRQSEMVFQHVKNLGDLTPSLYGQVAAVAVSAKPRPAEDSYMPVFAVSDSAGKTIAAVTGAKLYRMTHQHGHIGAAMFHQNVDGDFLGIHVSGGTTDVVLASAKEGVIEHIEQVGSTRDIAAGQLIDRVGVRLGLDFPCGPEMERVACGEPMVVKSSVKGTEASFSGAEAAAFRLIEQGTERGVVALSVLKCVAKTVEKLILNGRNATGAGQVLLFGGVMCNQYIKDFLLRRIGGGLFFANRAFSSDNACGLAMQARNLFLREGNYEPDRRKAETV